jgi:hypothetical protein
LIIDLLLPENCDSIAVGRLLSQKEIKEPFLKVFWRRKNTNTLFFFNLEQGLPHTTLETILHVHFLTLSDTCYKKTAIAHRALGQWLSQKEIKTVGQLLSKKKIKEKVFGRRKNKHLFFLTYM